MSPTIAQLCIDTSPSHRRLIAIVPMLAMLFIAHSAAAQDASLWERSPYRLALVVTSDRTAGLEPDTVSALKQQLTRAIEVRIGSAWQLHPEKLSGKIIEPKTVERAPTSEVETSPAKAAEPASGPTVTTASINLEQRLKQLARRGLSGLPGSELAGFSIDLDKVLFVHVRSHKGAAASGLTVEVRDYDIRTGILGTTISKACEQRPMLGAIAFDALLSAFSPLAEVDTVTGDVVSLRLKASALPLRDQQLQLVEPGDLFQPIVRYNYRDGSLRRFQELEWTCLQATNISATAVESKLYTGLRSPISSRRRGLTEQLAVVVRPPTGDTRLQVLSTAAESEPLPGYEIYAQAPGQVPTQLLGETDRTGSLTIPAGETPLRILLVKNGGEVLARLPIVPGAEPSISVKVPDDRLRLRAEAIITGIQEQVIDVLSRRQVLLAQAESQWEQGNIERAQTMLRELQLLKSAGEFQAELNTQERKIFTNDPRMKRRIDKLFGDTREVVRIHLDPKPIETLAAEIKNAGS